MAAKIRIWNHDKKVSINRAFSKAKSGSTFFILLFTVLSLYLDERSGVQGDTSMRLRELPRAQPKGTPETECWYFLYSPT